jgi:hypothetical protein
MGNLTLSAYDYVLKYQYAPAIQKQFNDEPGLYKRIKKSADNIDGKGRSVLFPVLTNGGESVGARADDAVLPTADSSTYRESTTTLKHNYATLRINGTVIRASKGNKAAFAQATTSEMENKTNALKFDIERQLFGYGKGYMSQLAAAYSTTTIAVDNPGTMYLRPGMVVDLIASGSKTATAAIIAAVSDTNSTVTFTGGGAVTGVGDNDYIVRANAYGIEMMGLLGIVDDDTLLASLQGIDSGDYPVWQGKVYDAAGTNRALSLALMQTAYSYCEKQMKAPSAVITSYGVRDKYADLLTADKRHVNTLKLDGGFTAIEFNSSPVIPLASCWPNKMFFLQESMLEIGETAPPDWASEDGSILHKVSTYDSYEADLVYDAELGAKRRNCHAVLADITE